MKDKVFFVAAALLAVALAVGGAGQNFPLLEMLLDLLALAAAVLFLWYPQSEALPTLSRCAVLLVGAVLLLPLCQLIPLPPSLWQALPGRDVVVQIDAGSGIAGWRPLTLDVEGTIRAALNLIPACVLLVLVLHLHTYDRAKLLVIIAAFALFGAILGIVQLATGGSLTPYPSAHIGYPIGLFVNRNHHALFLLLAMPMVAATAARFMRRSQSDLAYLAAALAVLIILAIAVVGTTSRMAMALLPVALVASLALLFFRQSVWRVAVPSMLALTLVVTIVSWVGGFDRTLARFSSLHDGRLDYWSDVSWALQHYGLAGTGFGTFIPVFKTAESLSSVSPAILNHAHNDFIEIVLEGGIPAIVLLAAFLAILAATVTQMMRKKLDFERAAPRLAALTGILLTLIFSLVDYPLRMPALSCVFAVLCGCVLPSPVPVARGTDLVAAAARRTLSVRTAAVRLTALVTGCALVLAVLQAGVSASALLSNRYEVASAWAPWSTAAHEGRSDDALGSGPTAAIDEAIYALRLSPIDADAVRTVAMGRAAAGSVRSGQQLMDIAASLGWRDALTQLWAIGASQQTGEPEKAVERAEALFQQDLFFPSAVELLLRDAPSGVTANELVRALAQGPQWRARFFKAVGQLPASSNDRVAQFAVRLNRTRAPLTVEEVQPLVDRLIANGQIERASWLWTQARRDNLVANGDFGQLSDRNGVAAPAAWDISDEDLATIAIQIPPFESRGRALRVSSAARSGAILSQRLLLRPGSYLLSFVARSDGPSEAAVAWELRCSSSPATQSAQEALVSPGRWRRFDVDVTVPVQDCPIQRLALRRPTDIHPPEVWIDRIILQPRFR
jgi:O-antigen ligase